MNKRLIRLAISLGTAILLMVVLVLITPEKDAPRVLILLGGVMPEGLIQGATYFLFIFGVMELLHLKNRIDEESDAFSAHLLPETENYIISAEDANQLKLNMQKLDRTRRFFLSDLIKKACTKYRLSKSSSEVLSLCEAQIKLYDAEIESEQKFIDYVAWAIPSVGFIGTVLGIAASLGYADQASSAEGIKKVTGMLAVAFDTTLVALLLSLVVMWLIHLLRKRQEELFTRMNSYIIENLINRFYK